MRAIDDHAVDLNAIKKELYSFPQQVLSISNPDDMIAKAFLADLSATQDHALKLRSHSNALSSSVQTKASIPSIHTNDFTSSAHSIVLTPREEQCLQLYRLGKTAKETARILSLSPRTVEEYLNNIKAK